MAQSLDEIFDTSAFDTVEESLFSYITRAYYRSHCDGVAIAIKSASYLPEYSQEPHDIVKELKILSSLSHINIIEVLGSTTEPDRQSLHFWMPFVPYCLSDLLDSVAFSSISGRDKAKEDVIKLSRSLIVQITVAIRYLHEQGIAHRDIKPRNILITREGTVKLIDFGISWSEAISSSDAILWPEPRGHLCSQVCSGPYRAPETIFGATSYDPFALDAWSLGATLAEFFTPLRFIPDDEDAEELQHDDALSDDEDEQHVGMVRPAFINPPISDSQRGRWKRESLFDAERGSIGLAWSIFKARGTPNNINWSTFKDLPNASSVIFQDAHPVDLRTLLPHLPSDTDGAIAEHKSPEQHPDHFPPSTPINLASDFIWRFLVYPSGRRMAPAQALEHPWIRQQPVLLPPGYMSSLTTKEQEHVRSISGENLFLQDLLQTFVGGSQSRASSPGTN